MKRIYSTLLSLSLLTASQLVLADVNAEQAENFYKRTCATCHGKSAEKSAFGQSRIINTLNSEEIYTALSDRKSGKIQWREICNITDFKKGRYSCRIHRQINISNGA